jgi:alkylhydroperoxidase/carboxymuconolactone decarboxylase family protein YurZ
MIRDRRLPVLGATVALGGDDLIDTQARAALVNSEPAEVELEEAVLQLHYYVGRSMTRYRGLLDVHYASASLP